MTVAFVTSLAALASASTWGREWIPPTPTLADRLSFTLQADLLVVGWLAAAVGSVAAGRFFSEEDIAGAGLAATSPRLNVRAALLGNTLEQVVLAVPAHLALATVLRPDEMALILALVLLFSLGRLAFWLSYVHGAGARALGFGLTFYPSVLALLLTGGLALMRD